MSTMEFEEMRKIWDSQNDKVLYAIDEEALHQRIAAKKKGASRRMNLVEISLMIINSACGTFLLYDAIVDKEGPWDYALAIIMYLTVFFLIGLRQRRKKRENTFDRSMLGELDHAIANSQSMIQMTTIMMVYYFLPLGIFSIVKMIVQGASIEKWLLIIGAYSLAYVIVFWERKNCHIPRKEHLERLKDKLVA